MSKFYFPVKTINGEVLVLVVDGDTPVQISVGKESFQKVKDFGHSGSHLFVTYDSNRKEKTCYLDYESERHLVKAIRNQNSK